ncbi:MAG TPA: SDR family NAD(P)-dependent oxidoreductase [Polyangiaceae bacterium]|nr:SDR family NAD(P)-dependent oxidoreductase [Polyangiaceae bacterium]
MNLSGNTILITGGSSGIGLAMAEAFLAHGNEIAVCARRQDRLLAAQAKHPEILVRECNVGEQKDREALIEWVQSMLPRLNVLVNNAGIQRDIDFTSGAAQFLSGESEIKINLEAPIALSGMFVPQLAGKPGATIVNVSSGLGFVPSAKMPVYSATKAGIHAFTMALRKQVERLGIRVVEVVPPAVDTELNPAGRAKRGGFRPVLSAATFVAAVMKGLESDAREIGYGTTISSIHASRAELDRAFEQMNSRT